MDIKIKYKKEYDEIKFVSDYFKVIKNNLFEFGCHVDDLNDKALEICDKNLGIDTLKVMTGDSDFKPTSSFDLLRDRINDLKMLGEVKTSDIAKVMHVSPQQVNKILYGLGLIVKKGTGWIVTDKGEAIGGSDEEGIQSRMYVVWTDIETLVDLITDRH